jgi:hypothetical protein
MALCPLLYRSTSLYFHCQVNAVFNGLVPFHVHVLFLLWREETTKIYIAAGLPLEEEMSCCIVLERVWSASAAVLLGKKSCACLFIKKSLAFIDFL